MKKILSTFAVNSSSNCRLLLTEQLRDYLLEQKVEVEVVGMYYYNLFERASILADL
jgi:hypothetical protein